MECTFIRYSRFIMVLLLLSGSSSLLSGQDGYSISLNVSGAPNTQIRMAYHLGNQQYIRDSIITDIAGKCVFSGKEKLPEGVYMIVFPDNKYFEFLLSKDQDFIISCNRNDLANSVIFRGSEENTNFIDYQRKWKSLQDEASSVSSRLKGQESSGTEATALRQKLKDQEEKMKNYLQDVYSRNRGSLLGAIARSLIPVKVEQPKIPAGVDNPDSVTRLYSYIYHKDHFFDNTDFTQPGLIRSPVLAGKLEQFFRQVVIQLPDSIIKESDKLLDRPDTDRDVYQYIAAWIFNRYVSSEIMGHDAVVVHLADKVYLSGKATWVSKDYLEDLSKRVERIRPNLIGKRATDLVMDSFTGRYVSLYDVETEFTVLYFWEPDCGHCKEATPLLKKYYDANRGKGIEVFAVCTQSDRDEWEKYINDNDLRWINGWDPKRLTRYDFYYNVESTPLVYILDREKKIIAKKLPVESIGSFIENYRKYSGHLQGSKGK